MTFILTASCFELTMRCFKNMNLVAVFSTSDVYRKAVFFVLIKKKLNHNDTISSFLPDFIDFQINNHCL